jgi:hypothetical protein
LLLAEVGTREGISACPETRSDERTPQRVRPFWNFDRIRGLEKVFSESREASPKRDAFLIQNFLETVDLNCAALLF